LTLNMRTTHSSETSAIIYYTKCEIPEDNTFVGLEVFTAVVMKSTIFWDITPCSPLSVNRVSEEHITSIFRVEKLSSARNQRASRWQELLVRWFLAELIFRP
jgi:hypothetical protein